MNYEEMLNKREGVAVQTEQTPLGTFYKKRIENKYRYVIELRPELAESLVFAEALKADSQHLLRGKTASLLDYQLNSDSAGIYELELRQGNYQTLAQLLDANPAVLAQKGFADQMVSALIDVTEKLHEAGLFQLCFDTRNIFVRKSDNLPLLLCQGSSFMQMKRQDLLYKGFEQTVAPEVLAGGHADARCDVYALGRFIEQLFSAGSMGYEYKKVVARATAAEPEQRFQTIEEMRSALNKNRGLKRSAIMAIAAIAVAALLMFLFFDLVPEGNNVEFIDQNGLVTAKDPFAEDYETDTPYDPTEYLDPEVAAYLDSIPAGELSQAEWDSVVHITNVEKIFNDRFSRMAEQRLSKLYSSEQMGSSQTDFISQSQTIIGDLMDYARQQAKDCGLTDEQALLIADQIISRIQGSKQSMVSRFGSMTQSSDDE